MNVKRSIIFPNQLFFPNPILSKNRKVFIIEDPLFFQDHEYPVKFHKQKLLLHFLSLDSYQNELVKNGYDVIRIDLKKLKYPKFYDEFLKENKITEVHYAELNDYTLNKRLKILLLLKRALILGPFYLNYLDLIIIVLMLCFFD